MKWSYLQDFFNATLGARLLYKFEYPQYDEIIEQKMEVRLFVSLLLLQFFGSLNQIVVHVVGEVFFFHFMRNI